jgi:hypothetical protein
MEKLIKTRWQTGKSLLRTFVETCKVFASQAY